MLLVKRRNADGTLSERTPIKEGETPEQKIKRLEEENESLKVMQSELTYQLMMKGVI
jgi:hypothetical protein